MIVGDDLFGQCKGKFYHGNIFEIDEGFDAIKAFDFYEIFPEQLSGFVNLAYSNSWVIRIIIA